MRFQDDGGSDQPARAYEQRTRRDHPIAEAEVGGRSPGAIEIRPQRHATQTGPASRATVVQREVENQDGQVAHGDANKLATSKEMLRN